MKDANGNELAIGDTVERAGQKYIVDGFDGDLVICKQPPPDPGGFNFAGDDPDTPQRPFMPDLARYSFVAAELVKV